MPFIKPTLIIMPDVIPDSVRKVDKRRVAKYSGIKEDVYVPYFKPDPNIVKEIGLKGEGLVITIRPPATEAHYHNPESEKLFEAVIDFLGTRPNNQLIILPRDDRQIAFIRRTWPKLCTNGRIIVPNRVIDGLNAIWHSDLVISGGGTMNREAAALGVPVYTIFRGKIGAVDQHLAETGRLTLIQNTEDVRTKIALVRRNRPPNPQNVNQATLGQIVDHIETIVRC